DHVSGGRLEFGLGAAWYELEHTQYGIPFPSIGVRMDMLDEACQVIRLLLDEKVANFEGEHYRLTDARCEPKPLQRHVPLWIGGSGERRTLRIVAERADGWNTFMFTPEVYRLKVEVLERHCRDVGRDPAEIRKQVVGRMLIRETEDELEEAVRERADRQGVEPAQIREEIFCGSIEPAYEHLLQYLRLGVQDFLLGERPPGDRRSMELLARRIGPA